MIIDDKQYFCFTDLSKTAMIASFDGYIIYSFIDKATIIIILL